MPARSKDHAALGKAIKQIRQEKKLTQAEVAEAMNTPATFLSDIERGVRNPALSTLYGLADALGVKLSQILQRAKQ